MPRSCLFMCSTLSPAPKTPTWLELPLYINKGINTRETTPKAEDRKVFRMTCDRTMLWPYYGAYGDWWFWWLGDCSSKSDPRRELRPGNVNCAPPQMVLAKFPIFSNISFSFWGSIFWSKILAPSPQSMAKGIHVGTLSEVTCIVENMIYIIIKQPPRCHRDLLDRSNQQFIY
jgi:hypothetical protein